MVETEQRRSRFANFRHTDDAIPIESEMLGPAIYARIEQPAEPSGAVGNCGDIGPFKTIAEDARQCQVCLVRWSAVFFAYDMFDLTAEKCILLVNQAIFAQTLRPLTYEPSEARRYAAHSC
jgi:hypothetical protein